MKLSGFGTFILRNKAERVGRNPKTGVEVPTEQRRVMLFNPRTISRLASMAKPVTAKTKRLQLRLTG